MILPDPKRPISDGPVILRPIEAVLDLKSKPVVMLTSSCEARSLPRSHEHVTNARATNVRAFVGVVKEVRPFWDTYGQLQSKAERDL